MTECQIRPMQQRDIADLSQLYLDARRETFTWVDAQHFKLNDFRDATQDELVWVAEMNEQLLGFIAVWPAENFIHHLYVDKQHQHQGIGTKLLTYALSEISRPAQLKCKTQNLNALRFYQKNNWTIVSERFDSQGPYYLLQLE